MLTEPKRQILQDEFQGFDGGEHFTGARLKSRELEGFYVHVNSKGVIQKIEEENEQGRFFYQP